MAGFFALSRRAGHLNLSQSVCTPLTLHLSHTQLSLLQRMSCIYKMNQIAGARRLLRMIVI